MWILKMSLSYVDNIKKAENIYFNVIEKFENASNVTNVLKNHEDVQYVLERLVELSKINYQSLTSDNVSLLFKEYQYLIMFYNSMLKDKETTSVIIDVGRALSLPTNFFNVISPYYFFIHKIFLEKFEYEIHDDSFNKNLFLSAWQDCVLMYKNNFLMFSDVYKMFRDIILDSGIDSAYSSNSSDLIIKNKKDIFALMCNFYTMNTTVNNELSKILKRRYYDDVLEVTIYSEMIKNRYIIMLPNELLNRLNNEERI